MPYNPALVAPMREEMVRLGARELKTVDDVDAALGDQQGTMLVFVNSVCGCAAGKARPGIAMALQHPKRPDALATVFAGADVEATDRARGYFTGYPPSSPSIGILRDGKLVYMLERREIESRSAEMIAAELTRAFERLA
jgi:putative YphP/YqiW family bacilliredoxin